jgi:hypothetical protein
MTLRLISLMLAAALTLTSTHTASAESATNPTAQAIATAKRIPGSLVRNIPSTSWSIVSNMPGPDATDAEVRGVVNADVDDARIVAFRRTFIVTALYDGMPFRVMDVVIDSEGLAYSTSQQSFMAPNGDELRVRVTSYNPITVDVSVAKADARVAASRDRIAFGDLDEGSSALAVREGSLAVKVNRLADAVDLRHQSILVDPTIRLRHIAEL